jgi:hypothetical protein
MYTTAASVVFHEAFKKDFTQKGYFSILLLSKFDFLPLFNGFVIEGKTFRSKK